MRYIDPVTGKQVAKSAGTRDREKAIGKAAVWQDELNSGRYKAPSKLSWAEFREKYEAERLITMAMTGRRSVTSAFNHLERAINPDRLRKLTTPVMGRFVAELRKPRKILKADGKEETLSPIREATIACYLRSIKAALRWAERMGLLAVLPRFDMPDAGEAKGRALSGEEYDRLLAAVSKVRPRDNAPWEQFIRGLWLSGLRLGEALALSWDLDAPLAVDLSGKFPALQIAKRAQKSRKAERWPLPPDFAEWLLQTPEGNRTGRVFRLPSLRNGQPISQTKTGILVAKMGKAARIVVAKDPDTGKVKYASAHDLRRSFGTRWAKKVMPAVLQKLMRHADIATTMKYYVQIGADDVAAELWAKFPAGDTPGDIYPKTAAGGDGAAAGEMTESPGRKRA
jgi:integrase